MQYKGDTLCNPQKGVLIIIDSVVQHANAQRKSAATRASHLHGETSSQVVPPHCTHTSEETHTLQQTHTLEEMYSESEDEENTDSEDKAHTLQETHTPEEMHSESENEENADSEDEDQSQCLAMEVDNQEIDDIMWEVFGDENMLL